MHPAIKREIEDLQKQITFFEKLAAFQEKHVLTEPTVTSEIEKITASILKTFPTYGERAAMRRKQLVRLKNKFT